MDLGHIAVRLDDGGWLSVPIVRSGFDDVPTKIWLAAEADCERRFKAEAVLADEIVAKAVKDAWELGKASAARVSIFSTRPKHRGARLTRRTSSVSGSSDRRSSLTGRRRSRAISSDGAIPTGTGDSVSPSPTAPKTKPRSFKITD